MSLSILIIKEYHRKKMIEIISITLFDIRRDKRTIKRCYILNKIKNFKTHKWSKFPL